MDKFGRNYTLLIQDPTIGDFIEVKLPFTIEFDIQRSDLSQANVASIRVYNLSKNNRDRIRHDQWDIGVFQACQLKAGYGNTLATIFAGNIQQAWSFRENVNFITQIESLDNGFALANATANTEFISGTPLQTVVETLAGLIPNASIGAIGEYTGNLSRGNSYSGNPCEILDALTGGGFFVDNGKIFCLNDNEVTFGAIQVINSQSGLLGTPLREFQYVNINILFEPRVSIGQKIRLESFTDSSFNGDYRIKSIHHKGMISQTVSGTAITSLGLAKGNDFIFVGN